DLGSWKFALLQPVLTETDIELLARQAKRLRRERLVESRGFERPLNRRAFDRSQIGRIRRCGADRLRLARARSFGGPLCEQIQVFTGDQAAVTENRGALQRIAQFADVT